MVTNSEREFHRLNKDTSFTAVSTLKFFPSLTWLTFNTILSFYCRQFFERVYPPDQRGEYLDTLLNKFSVQFCATNCTTSFTPGKSQ